ncbi:MAG: DUF4835 family protein [Bacteroidota bacterium]
MRKFFLLLLSIVATGATAQELNCSVQINTQLQKTDQSVFTDMKKGVTEFMNNRKWTNDNFTQSEKIECTLIINITKELGSDKYQAQATIQSNRPVFNSSYNTTLLNWVDKDWTIEYVQYQSFDFNDNATTTELTSLLAYYAYVIIGLDYDSFSPLGGTPYYAKAKNIVNLNSNTATKGWRSIDGTRNRYWLVENLTNAKFENGRTAIYKYHREGLDKMYEDPENARKAITSSFGLLDKLNQDNPVSMFIQIFFTAKVDEIVNIFSQATPLEKTTVVNLVSKMDAANSSKYQKIMKQ